MLDQSGIESLLPPRLGTTAPTSATTVTNPPGTVTIGDRVVFDSRDQINYNLPTESPEMIQQAAAITPAPIQPVEYTIAPVPPPPSTSSSSILVYIAILAILICCLMACMYFVSRRGGKNVARNINQYNMSGLYN